MASDDRAEKALVSTYALTVPEFCSAHSMSRALFYKLRVEGRGPRIMKVGKRTLVSVEAAAEWRRQMEAAAQGGAR